MSLHIPDDVLECFVLGDLDEERAVQVATHIDECSFCANRAAAIEPLGLAFASVEDPELPETFKANVLAELNRPRFPAVEFGVGIGLLIAAASLIWLVEGPVTPVVDSFTFAHATSSVLEGLTSTLSLGEQAALVMLALIGGLGTLRFAAGGMRWFGRRTA
ncbi:MAG: hypothetical protein AAGA48_39045 [Myxococcota bacterium]